VRDLAVVSSEVHVDLTVQVLVAVPSLAIDDIAVVDRRLSITDLPVVIDSIGGTLVDVAEELLLSLSVFLLS